MSFSTDCKKEITGDPPKKPCCRRALLCGVLAARGEVNSGTVTVYADKETCVALLESIRDVYGKNAVISAPKKGGRGKALCFSSPAAEKYLRGVDSEEPLIEERCPLCRENFLRGVFLVSGRVSDPERQYSLEFSLYDRADVMQRCFENAGLKPKLARRRNETVLYFRKSESIEDFFVSAGMNGTAFIFMNRKIVKDMRNDARRIANCETNNIGKAVDVAVRQIAVIERLADAHLLASLPEELEATARLRLQYPDVSLSRLASLSTPPISKSGISHRRKRIMEAGEVMLSANGQNTKNKTGK